MWCGGGNAIRAALLNDEHFRNNYSRISNRWLIADVYCFIDFFKRFHNFYFSEKKKRKKKKEAKQQFPDFVVVLNAERYIHTLRHT